MQILDESPFPKQYNKETALNFLQGFLEQLDSAWGAVPFAPFTKKEERYPRKNMSDIQNCHLEIDVLDFCFQFCEIVTGTILAPNDKWLLAGANAWKGARKGAGGIKTT